MSIPSNKEAFMEILLKSSNGAVVDSGSLNITDEQMCIDPTLYTKAENCKKELSNASTTSVTCTLPMISKNISDRDNRHPPVAVEISIDITRDEFEDVCSDIFERALVPVHRLLESLGKYIHLKS